MALRKKLSLAAAFLFLMFAYHNCAPPSASDVNSNYRAIYENAYSEPGSNEEPQSFGTAPGTSDTPSAAGSPECPTPISPLIKIIDTEVSVGFYPRTSFHAQTVWPEIIYSFKFTTADTADTGNWIATALTASNGKTLKITRCPGILDDTSTYGACERFTTESTRIDYVVNRPDLSLRSHCHLLPNTVYFANVISKFSLEGELHNCENSPNSSIYNCGFSMVGE